MFHVVGLAEDRAIDRDGGIGNEDRRWPVAAGHAAGVRRLGLRYRHAAHIGLGRFAGAFGLQRFGVFVGARQEQLEAYAELAQQFLAAWALRGEVDERVKRGGGRRRFGHRRSREAPRRAAGEAEPRQAR